jgi:SAM-dependent methyltransferase
MVAEQRHSRDAGWPATGSGPGAIAPDGCSVELYAILPAGDEPAIVHEAAGDGASILELGAGAGRVTHPLLALGHPVVAVDESPEMLERIHGAERVHSRIEELDLGREFDAVLLASHLVNIPDVAWRRTLLATCRRHLRPHGKVLIQRHPPDWIDTAEPFDGPHSRLPDLVMRLRDLERPGPGLLSATVDYQVGDQVWSQSFTAARVDDEQLAADLGAVGLAFDRQLTADGSWVSARRAGG